MRISRIVLARRAGVRTASRLPSRPVPEHKDAA
jgi:hypothetical protein